MKQSLSKRIGVRSMITNKDAGFHEPESLEDMQSFIDKQKPELFCIYFHAAWNPVIPKIEDEYRQMIKRNGNFTHFKIDTDQHHRLKHYYDCRVEPTFTLYVNGGEITRMVGYNFNKLEKLMN